MTSCRKCGLLVHIACAPPPLPGREIVCPRCQAASTEDIEDGRVDGTMARRYDIRSKPYESPAPSASVRAQAGSKASTSSDPTRVAAPFNGAVAGEQETAARQKEALQEETRARANMKEFFKQTLGRRKDPGEKEVCPLNRRPTDEEAEMAGFLNARSWYL